MFFYDIRKNEQKNIGRKKAKGDFFAYYAYDSYSAFFDFLPVYKFKLVRIGVQGIRDHQRRGNGDEIREDG